MMMMMMTVEIYLCGLERKNERDLSLLLEWSKKEALRESNLSYVLSTQTLNFKYERVLSLTLSVKEFFYKQTHAWLSLSHFVEIERVIGEFAPKKRRLVKSARPLSVRSSDASF